MDLYNMQSILFFVTVTCTVSPPVVADWCYTSDPEPYRDYAEYSTYLDSQGTPPAQHEEIPGCQVKHFYSISRHGIRHPSNATTDAQWTLMPRLQDQIIRNHFAGHGKLCLEDLQLLINWQPQTKDSERETVAEPGWQELRELAQRYEIRFPELLSLDYTEETRDHYYIRHTSLHRSRDAARAFSEGLFGFWDGVDMLEVPQEDDTLLRFYNICPKYTEEVVNQPNIQRELFLLGPEVTAMIARVEERLGFHPGNLNWDLVYEMYDNCRLDHGIYSVAPWCVTLTQDDLEVINYSEDLAHYWEQGYGQEINYEMACEIPTDIVESFDDAIITDATATSLHFAHGSTLYPLIARLGLYNDTVPLLASNYNDRESNLWDTTNIVPNAANFAFALYECEPPRQTQDKAQAFDSVEQQSDYNLHAFNSVEQQSDSQQQSSYFVKFYHNEDATLIPGCSNILCPYAELVELWSDITTNCDFDEICAYP